MRQPTLLAIVCPTAHGDVPKLLHALSANAPGHEVVAADVAKLPTSVNSILASRRWWQHLAVAFFSAAIKLPDGFALGDLIASLENVQGLTGTYSPALQHSTLPWMRRCGARGFRVVPHVDAACICIHRDLLKCEPFIPATINGLSELAQHYGELAVRARFMNLVDDALVLECAPSEAIKP